MMRSLGLAALLASASSAAAVSSPAPPSDPPPQNRLDSLAASFRLPEPASLPAARNLWATHYYVFSARAVQDGYPLLAMNGSALGPRLSGRDWCLGAIEGTIRVTNLDGSTALYNYHGVGSTQTVPCTQILSGSAANASTGRVRFARVNAPFGLGARGSHLVPLRTIAVDRTVIPLGSLVYIPAARGQTVTLPSGAQVTHDGYFLAGDVGGAIRNNHIDVFAGETRANPFPGFVRSRRTPTFEAYVLTDAETRAAMQRLHKWPGS